MNTNEAFSEAVKYALANKPTNREQAEKLYKVLMNEMANWCIQELDTRERIGFKYAMGMYFDMPSMSITLN